MAVHEYIGARYVPKFMGTYDATQIYEALCVVDNGLGTSYISKVPTPAGTPLTDTDYWAVYGASSGAIINLQNQIDTINNTDLPALQGAITTINTVDIPAIQNDIQSLSDDLDDLSVTVGLKKRIVVITDSYGNSHGGASPFTSPLQTYLGLTNDDYFAYAEGSLGFNQAGLAGHTAVQLLTLHAGDITDHDTITHVIFVLGGNDIDNQTGLESAMNTCFSYVRSTYKNAKIVVAYSYNQLTKVPSYVVKYEKCIANYIKYCNKLDAVWVENYPYIMHNANYFYTDGVHPNNDGGEALARGLVGFLNDGQCDVKSLEECTFNSLTNVYSNTFRMSIDNGISALFGTVRVEAVSLNAGSNDIKVGSITTPLFVGTGLAAYMNGRALLGSGVVTPINLYLFEGDIYLNCVAASSDTIAAGTNIPITLTVPTLNT